MTYLIIFHTYNPEPYNNRSECGNRVPNTSAC